MHWSGGTSGRNWGELRVPDRREPAGAPGRWVGRAIREWIVFEANSRGGLGSIHRVSSELLMGIFVYYGGL